jgi:hypothetical protein
MRIPNYHRSLPMKIPIQLSFRLFNETTTIKTSVEDLHIGKTMDMYKNIMIPLFGEENYENTILSIANEIKNNRKKEPIVYRIIKWIDNLFKE